MVNRRDIEAYSTMIAERFKPEMIILFGSYAYGTPNKDSDVDILVVMPHSGRANEMAFSIKSALPRMFPLDLIVRSSKELVDRIAKQDYFVEEILERGTVLYE